MGLVRLAWGGVRVPALPRIHLTLTGVFGIAVIVFAVVAINQQKKLAA